jgi:RNA polymerase sigma-B factor
MSTNELFEELRRTSASGLRDYLVERHEGLVRHVARDYLSSGEAYEDIVSVGHLGLVHAVDRFDPERGTKFATFAIPTIKGEIRRYFRDRTWGVRVPRRIQELSMRARKVNEQLSQQSGRAPTYAELAAVLGVPEDDVIEAIDVGRQYELLSIDTQTSESNGEEGLSPADRAGGVDPDIELLGDRDLVRRALAHLPERERVIVFMRFFRDMSQQEVGDRLGISQMHVSRLQQRALAKLKHFMERG